MIKNNTINNEYEIYTGSDTKACPVARGMFDSKKHGFGQVHGLI